jgi:putative transcriptional regulator
MPKAIYIDVRKLRESMQLSQPKFCEQFGLCLGTLRDWERGRRCPEGPALVLLSVIRHSPHIVREAIGTSIS